MSEPPFSTHPSEKKMTHRLWIFGILSVVLASSMLTTFAAGAKPAADYVWVEGEAPQSHSMTRHPWWYD